MKKVLKTFQTFMEEALKKSLPELSLVPAAAPHAGQKIMQARLGFEGKNMRAQAFLSCSEDFLQMTCPLPRGEEDHSVDTVIDWLGELGNLILGRLKNRLLAHDVTIKISAPDFAGNWARPDNAESVAVWFECDGTLIGFECVVEGRVPEIGDAIQQSAEILPGDAIYRLNDTMQNAETVDLLSKIRSGVEDSLPMEEPRIERAEKRELAQPKSFPMHFHSAKDPVVTKVQSPHIIAVTWPSLENLTLKFSCGLEFQLCPKTLLDQGIQNLEIEGLAVSLKRDGDVVRVSLPKLHMHLSKSLRQAG